MSAVHNPWRQPAHFRLFVSRDQGLHALPGEYDDIEEAKQVFETHHGEVGWCLLAEIEPRTERPLFLLHGVAGQTSVEWKPVA